jgi:hypothetical protein
VKPIGQIIALKLELGPRLTTAMQVVQVGTRFACIACAG